MKMIGHQNMFISFDAPKTPEKVMPNFKKPLPQSLRNMVSFWISPNQDMRFSVST